MRNFRADRESNVADGYLYHFGQFVLDSRKRTASRVDSCRLTAKPFGLLVFVVPPTVGSEINPSSEAAQD